MGNKIQKIIFVHIPKTGGSSIKNSLRSSIRRTWDLDVKNINSIGSKNFSHTSRHQWSQIIDLEEWQSCFTFSFVRNPYDRFVSIYCHFKKSGLIGGNISFEEFLISSLKNHDLENTLIINNYNEYSIENFTEDAPYKKLEKIQLHIKPQTDFLFSQKREIDLDFLGRFENLKVDYDKICRYLSVYKKNLSHMKKSNRNPYKEYYQSTEIKAILEEVYLSDLEAFDYAF